MPDSVSFCAISIFYLTIAATARIIKISPVGGYGDAMDKHENTAAVRNRLSRAIGHLTAVKKMVEAGRECSDILIQLSAVKSEIVNVSKIILKDHLSCCIVNAVKENDKDAIEQLKAAIDKLL